jgi:hypothetical protein
MIRDIALFISLILSVYLLIQFIRMHNEYRECRDEIRQDMGDHERKIRLLCKHGGEIEWHRREYYGIYYHSKCCGICKTELKDYGSNQAAWAKDQADYYKSLETNKPEVTEPLRPEYPSHITSYQDLLCHIIDGLSETADQVIKNNQEIIKIIKEKKP